jgi:hypothetical protein
MKLEDILPYLSSPQPILDALAAECHNVCLLTYGNGNPDLAGIGMRLTTRGPLIADANLQK